MECVQAPAQTYIIKSKLAAAALPTALAPKNEKYI